MNIFCNTIIFVKSIEVSRKFYENILGLKVREKFETIVFYENNFTIHDGSKLSETVFGKRFFFRKKWGRKNLLVYVESNDVNSAYDDIVKSGVKIIHPVRVQEWGQKVFRFYDPDGHIVEIGEAVHLKQLIKDEKK